jgi:anhydro-N-acetylmuramic acid kinase
MSGTSLDGVDAVLVDFTSGFQLLGHKSKGFDPALKAALLSLNSPAHNEIHTERLAANALAKHYAEVCGLLLQELNIQSTRVAAIGAHGQTIRHRPSAFDGVGYTVQTNNAALLAELTQITVCADFRTRDVAAGGQGAPLVPAFHKSLFSQAQSTVCVLNLGGISNISVLPPKDPVQPNGQTTSQSEVIGFDCGPANCLMDEWCLLHTGQPFDANGSWAAGGQVSEALLALFLADPYFSAPHPKSTGRDHFNMHWLNSHLKHLDQELEAQHVQATLAELCALSCANELKRVAPHASDLIVCGGGALNAHVMHLLSNYLPGVRVQGSSAFGLDPQHVEASAFAWLARACMHAQTGSLSSVTGAIGPRILGAIYQA